MEVFGWIGAWGYALAGVDRKALPGARPRLDKVLNDIQPSELVTWRLLCTG
jgi:hypothetical protein